MRERRDDKSEGLRRDRIERTEDADGLDDPNPFRNEERHPGIEKCCRESFLLTEAKIADMEGSAHPIIRRASEDFGETAQSTASITPAAPPLFPEKSMCAR